MSPEFWLEAALFICSLVGAYFANRITFVDRLARIETKLDALLEVESRLTKLEVDTAKSGAKLNYIESYTLNGGRHGKQSS